jgi:hypothetical protein
MQYIECAGSVAHYFNTVSNAQYTIYGSNVTSWYSLPFTMDNVLKQANDDIRLTRDTSKQPELRVFYKVKELCIQV